MNQFSSFLQSVLLLIVLVISTVFLKRKKVISEDLKKPFSRLITDYILPALVFASLAYQDINIQQFIPATIMLCAISSSMAIGYIAGRLLGLNKERLGVFVILTGFGSSSSLGYPLIKEIFPGNTEAMADALIVGELGAVLPFFIIGVFILRYFGDRKRTDIGFGTTLFEFIKSPIFLCMAGGLVVSFLGIPLDNVIGRFIHKVLMVIGDSLVLFVAITVGLMLKPVKIKTVWILITVIVLVKLIFEPLFALTSSIFLHVPELEAEVLVIESAMPAGAIASVFAERYGCDGEFASVVVIATYIISIFTLPLVFLAGGF